MAQFERQFNGEGILQQILQRLAGRMKGGAGGLGSEPVEVPVDLKVTISSTPAAEANAVLDRLQGMQQRFGQGNPIGQRYGNWSWDDPSAYDDPGGMAQKRWAQLQGMGPVGMLRGIGSFNEKWGGYLQGNQDYQGWMGAAAKVGPAGSYSTSMENLEKAGRRMTGFIEELDKTDPNSGRYKAVAADIRALGDSMEELRQKALGAAKAIGGPQESMLSAATNDLADQAQAGAVPSRGGGGGYFGRLMGGISPSSITSLVSNPAGGAYSLIQQGLMSLAVRGGAPGATGWLAGAGGTALGADAGMLAAAAAGGIGSYKFMQGQVSDSAMDNAGFFGDYALGASMGGGFDMRGAYWRNNGDHYLGLDASHGMSGINFGRATNVLRSMNIGAGGWNGYGNNITQAMVESGNSIARGGMEMGLDEGALGGFFGNMIRSGGIRRDRGSVEGLLSQIKDQIHEANQVGVSSNERLGVLVTLRQQEQASMGMVYGGSSHFLDAATATLDQSRDPRLMGQAGGAIMGAFLGNQNPLMAARVTNQLLRGGRLSGAASDIAGRFLGKNWLQQQRAGGLSDWEIASDMQRDPGVKMFMQLQEEQKLESQGVPWFQIQKLTGLDSQTYGSTSAFFRQFKSGVLSDDAIRAAGQGSAPSQFTQDEFDKRYLNDAAESVKDACVKVTEGLNGVYEDIQRLIRGRDIGQDIRDTVVNGPWANGHPSRDTGWQRAPDGGYLPLSVR